MKHIQYVRYGLIAISIIVTGLFLGTMNQGTGYYPYIDPMFIWTYILLFVSIGLVIVFSIINMAKNPKSAFRSLVGIGALAVIIGISYAMSSSAPVVSASTVYDDPTVLRLSDVGLYTTYIACAVAILSIIGTEAVKLFKK